ncbi:hypothetical protein CN878_21010 [Ochrobactrum sp. 695/2009]|nr:hypothetical protein CN881_05340 [Ochrobactrum sp. 721/2009]PJT14616.1 hypothetical protein CN880_19210 [Ochrobactrum sp. 720/2009]PJT22218.1 hypothetical protein CN879_13080 [Ochrobactrum sp. 715/2009]PJT25239.1 hypothetical protein CN878_21010 [Ochrobactrum sp. 695/2009]PJT34410.1 hypothetical protein CN877_12710 [Ochrobactrum sp. 689/2009]
MHMISEALHLDRRKGGNVITQGSTCLSRTLGADPETANLICQYLIHQISNETDSQTDGRQKDGETPSFPDRFIKNMGMGRA